MLFLLHLLPRIPRPCLRLARSQPSPRSIRSTRERKKPSPRLGFFERRNKKSRVVCRCLKFDFLIRLPRFLVLSPANQATYTCHLERLLTNDAKTRHKKLLLPTHETRKNIGHANALDGVEAMMLSCTSPKNLSYLRQAPHTEHDASKERQRRRQLEVHHRKNSGTKQFWRKRELAFFSTSMTCVSSAFYFSSKIKIKNFIHNQDFQDDGLAPPSASSKTPAHHPERLPFTIPPRRSTFFLRPSDPKSKFCNQQ